MSTKSLKYFGETGRIRKLELAVWHINNPVLYQQGEEYPYGTRSMDLGREWSGVLTILTFRIHRDKDHKGNYIRCYDFTVRYSDGSFGYRENEEEWELTSYIRVGKELKKKKK